MAQLAERLTALLTCQPRFLAQALPDALARAERAFLTNATPSDSELEAFVATLQATAPHFYAPVYPDATAEAERLRADALAHLPPAERMTRYREQQPPVTRRPAYRDATPEEQSQLSSDPTQKLNWAHQHLQEQTEGGSRG